MFFAQFFAQMMSCAVVIMTSFIIPFPSILNIWKCGGLTALWFSMIPVHIDGHDRIYFDMADISVTSKSPTSRFT